MKELIVKGKPLPIHFGMRAINEFTKLQGLEFDKAVTSTDSLGNLDSVVSLAVSGLNEGARLSGKDDRYTEDNVWDMFDDNPQLIIEMSDIFIECVQPLTEKLGMLKNGKRPAGRASKPSQRK